MRRGYIKSICVLFTIAGASNDAVLNAIDNRDFRDFEDALQDCCAAEAGCDCIVTANGKDFIGHSQTAIKSPEAFLALFADTQA